jgi:hypothetical protein
VKPDIENIRGLNLAVVKLTTVQVTKLQLQYKICKIGMICSVEPVLTEDLRVVQKQDFLNNMLYVLNVHLTRPNTFIRDKPIFSSVRMLHKDYYRKGSVGEKKSLIVVLKGLEAKMN